MSFAFSATAGSRATAQRRPPHRSPRCAPGPSRHPARDSLV